MDRLKEMWLQQEGFMHLLRENREFPNFPVDISSKKGQQHIKAISHDCMHELFEAVQCLKNSKQHRKTDVDEFDRSAFLEELSDTLHYFLEICIMAGITQDELYEAYIEKGKTNRKRILSGY